MVDKYLALPIFSTILYLTVSMHHFPLHIPKFMPVFKCQKIYLQYLFRPSVPHKKIHLFKIFEDLPFPRNCLQVKDGCSYSDSMPYFISSLNSCLQLQLTKKNKTMQELLISQKVVSQPQLNSFQQTIFFLTSHHRPFEQRSG